MNAKELLTLVTSYHAMLIDIITIVRNIRARDFLYQLIGSSIQQLAQADFYIIRSSKCYQRSNMRWRWGRRRRWRRRRWSKTIMIFIWYGSPKAFIRGAAGDTIFYAFSHTKCLWRTCGRRRGRRRGRCERNVGYVSGWGQREYGFTQSRLERFAQHTRPDLILVVSV